MKHSKFSAYVEVADMTMSAGLSTETHSSLCLSKYSAFIVHSAQYQPLALLADCSFWCATLVSFKGRLLKVEVLLRGCYFVIHVGRMPENIQNHSPATRMPRLDGGKRTNKRWLMVVWLHICVHIRVCMWIACVEMCSSIICFGHRAIRKLVQLFDDWVLLCFIMRKYCKVDSAWPQTIMKIK